MPAEASRDAHACAPLIDTASDRDFIGVYHDNPTANDQQDPGGVWTFTESDATERS